MFRLLAGSTIARIPRGLRCDLWTRFRHARRLSRTQAVEAITGRVVRAFVSGIDTRHDVSSEVFYLEPLASRDGDGSHAASTM